MSIPDRLTFEMTIVLRNGWHPHGIMVNTETVQISCEENEMPRDKAHQALDKRNEELRKEGKGKEAHFGKLYKSY